jgi:hypothetical protein
MSKFDPDLTPLYGGLCFILEHLTKHSTIGTIPLPKKINAPRSPGPPTPPRTLLHGPFQDGALWPSAFHAPRLPTITLTAYLDRIVRYCPISTATYVVSFIYLDRITQKRKVLVNSHTIHRLLITRFCFVCCWKL